MSGTPEASVNSPSGDFSAAERLLAGRKWPFVGKLPLLRAVTVTGTSAQLITDTAKACFKEGGFSDPINVEPGTQDRLFYRKEPVYLGLLLTFRNKVRAASIQQRMRRRSALWLVIFFGFAVLMGLAISEPRHGGPIPWGYVPLIVFVSLPLEFIAIYYGVEILYSWWWAEIVQIVYCGLRPEPSDSTAVAQLTTDMRVWILGGRVLTAGGAFGHWRRYESDPELETMASTWLARFRGDLPQ